MKVYPYLFEYTGPVATHHVGRSVFIAKESALAFIIVNLFILKTEEVDSVCHSFDVLIIIN